MEWRTMDVDAAQFNNVVRSGDITEVQKLLEKHFRKQQEWPLSLVNQVSGGLSPLMVAAQLLDPDKRRIMIELLKAGGANIDLQTDGGWTVLMKEVSEGNFETVACLLEITSVNMKLYNYDNEGNALMIACQKGYLNLVELLLSHGANVNEVIAMRQSRHTIIYDNPIDKQKEDMRFCSGKSPLALALENNHLDVCDFLLTKNAKIINNRMDKNYPAKNPYSAEASKLLVKRGANFADAISSAKETLLLIFIFSQQIELVKMCLDEGHDVNGMDMYGIYPLWRAIDCKNFEIFELLWNKKPEANLRPNNKKSALEMLQENESLSASFLQKAFDSKNYSLMNFLLEIGAKPNADLSETLKTNTSLSELVNSKSQTQLPHLYDLLSKPELSSADTLDSTIPSSPALTGVTTSEVGQVSHEYNQFEEKKQSRDLADNSQSILLQYPQEQQYCLICEESIGDSSDSIFCKGANCNGLLHRQCAGLSRKAFELASKSPVFTCPKCELDNLKHEISAIKEILLSRAPAFGSIKRFSVVVQGIVECETGTKKHTRHEHDLKNIVSILSKVDDSIKAQSIRDHRRMGKYDKTSQRPRPILVHLVTSADSSNILSKRSSVEPPYVIQPYRTPAQQTQLKLAKSSDHDDDKSHD